jgi:hypothetical protein
MPTLDIESRLTTVEAQLTKLDRSQSQLMMLMIDIAQKVDTLVQGQATLQRDMIDVKRKLFNVGNYSGRIGNKLGNLYETLLGASLQHFFESTGIGSVKVIPHGQHTYQLDSELDELTYEVDVLLETAGALYLTEIKGTPRSEHLLDVLKTATRFEENPENKELIGERQVVPFLVGVAFDEEMMASASKRGVVLVRWSAAQKLEFAVVPRVWASLFPGQTGG